MTESEQIVDMATKTLAGLVELLEMRIGRLVGQGGQRDDWEGSLGAKLRAFELLRELDPLLCSVIDADDEFYKLMDHLWYDGDKKDG